MTAMAEEPAVTQLLAHAQAGDRAAEQQLLSVLYGQLHARARSMMGGEKANHTLQPTALVNETYLRLVGHADTEWKSRTHFLAVSSMVMRRVLVDHARARQRTKRGGGVETVSIDVGLQLTVDHDPDILALEDVLQTLSTLNPRQAEMICYRFFGGMTMAEIAEEWGVSKRSVEAEWTMAKAWLRRALTQR
jgi:RNA polymerase sigma factor (TIGR02999 family)